MNRLLNNKTLSFIFKVLICIAIAKSIALASFVFLPKSGIEISRGSNDIANFNTRNFAYSFSNANQGSASGAQVAQISNLKLLAIYKESNGKSAFTIISDGSSSEVLKIGDTYKQYRVNDIKSDGVFLLENGKEVWVGFAKSTFNSFAPTQPSNRFPDASRQFQQFPQQPNEEITTIIKRSEIDELMANPDAIFKNMGFKEVMKDGKLDGFRVLSINRNSPLAKLGIRTGDVIQSFNGVRLDNYSSVLEIYENAKSYSRVKVEVMRNNEKKEFEYEIY
ncbi:MAG: PDZ domain-containing protein [Campylobacteraceae bacterium]|jgi:type II secretion system protein C|nr:PDZ domain-containing protein [Campylobacteraceae bacterium]